MKNRQNAANHWKTKKNPGTIVAPGLFELAEKEGFEPSHKTAKNIGITWSLFLRVQFRVQI